MLEHILIPLDGSQLAEEALPAAKQILPEGGKITLITAIAVTERWLYGVDPLVVSAEYRQSIDQMEEAARTYLRRTAASLEAAGFHVATLIEYGNPASVILSYAADNKVDAIIMSTHGRSGINRWLFGSVTSKVLSAASCPVFVVPSLKVESRHEGMVTRANRG